MNKSGRWAVWKRMTLRRGDGVVYMARRRIVQTPWFALYLHRFDAPDPGVDLHDHPWWFTSIVLRGGYVEEIAPSRDAPMLARVAEMFPRSAQRGVERRWVAGTAHTLPMTHCHRITCLLRVPTWTLVIVGPRRRGWGFYESSGFVDSVPYSTLRRDLAVDS